MIALSALGSGGCHKALFTEREPRNQFESYDLMRQRYTPSEEPDVFGNMPPALRATLTRR